MLRMLSSQLRLLHDTRLTDLVGTDPFAFDRPHAAAPMVWIVSCKVAMFDQATASVIAEEVNDFELMHVSPSVYSFCALPVPHLTHV